MSAAIATPYQEWQEGTLGPAAALRALCSDLGEVEDELATLQAQRDALRFQVGEIVVRQDKQRADVPGFGRILFTAPGISQKYDMGQVDALVSWLADEGYTDIAERLAACKTKSMRVGGMRIERERPRADEGQPGSGQSE